MTGTVALAALLGLCITVGMLLMITGWVGKPDQQDGAAQPKQDPPWLRSLRDRRRDVTLRQILICATVGIAAMVITGWIAAGIVGAMGAYGLPKMIGPDRENKRRLARIEGVATWTENLRDTLSAAAGLEQAITATALTAPEAIRDEVTRLAARIRAGERLPASLRRLAAELDDPTGDLVVTALVMAAERHARNVTDLLSTLSQAARDQAQLRLKTAASRARIRTSVRVIVGTTLTMAIGMVVFNRPFLAPYGTATGQLMLLLVAGLFTLAFTWLNGISKIAEPSRLLTPPTDEPAAIHQPQPRTAALQRAVNPT